MKITKAILNDRIIYTPGTHSVCILNENTSQAMLAIPASLCLLLLLENMGTVVSHEEFYNKVWHVRGMNVTSNTLYQNISILRKILTALGLQNDFVRTVPRRGFIINQSSEVQIFHDKPDGVHENKEPPIVDRSCVNIMTQEKLTKPFSKVRMFFYLPFLLCVLTFSSYFIISFFSKTNIPTYTPAKYIKLEQFANCHVFRNKSFRNNGFFISFMEKNNLKCSHSEWWYITNYPPSHRISLFRCTKELKPNLKGETTLCLSDYYLGENDGER